MTGSSHTLNRFVTFFLGELPPSSSGDLRLRVAVFSIISWIGVVALGFFAFLAFLRGYFHLVITDLVVIVILLAAIIILRVTKKATLPFAMAALALIATCLVNFMTGGIGQSIPYWQLILPPLGLLLLGLKWGSAACLFLLVATLLLYLDPTRSLMWVHYDFTTALRFFAAYILIFTCSLVSEYLRFKTRQELKLLSGLLPICAHCKKIRDDQGYWNQLEEYISHHSEAQFTHGICPQCAKELFPELDHAGKGGAKS